MQAPPAANVTSSELPPVTTIIFYENHLQVLSVIEPIYNHYVIKKQCNNLLSDCGQLLFPSDHKTSSILSYLPFKWENFFFFYFGFSKLPAHHATPPARIPCFSGGFEMSAFKRYHGYRFRHDSSIKRLVRYHKTKIVPNMRLS